MKKVTKTHNNSSFFSELNLQHMFSTSRNLQPYQIYYELNKEVCSRIIFYNINHEKLFFALINQYSIKENDIISTQIYSRKNKAFGYASYLVPITKDLWVFHGFNDNEGESTVILYSVNTPKDKLNELQSFINSNENVAENIGKIYLMHKFDYGFDLRGYDVCDVVCDIKNHYNDDFEAVHSKIKEKLNQPNGKGLVMLYGKPGTGKTTYIRHLTREVNKKMIFLSPEVSQHISSPEFITILSEYPNSIIIIEDAENVIKTRKSGGTSAISNLLNLTDGLLADCLKIQLICTFNTDVSQIDKALLRKGRLIAMYEFNELNKQKAKDLATSIGTNHEIYDDTVLADIFNVSDVGTLIDTTAKIGY